MKSPSVLMFGWEFPPAMSGGLGVACLGLCKALAPLVDLKMIIPKSTPDFVLKNMELIGMNNLSISELKKTDTRKYYEQLGDVGRIDYSLNPYISSFDRKMLKEGYL